MSKFVLAEWPIVSSHPIVYTYHRTCRRMYEISSADSLMEVVIDHDCPDSPVSEGEADWAMGGEVA